MGMNDVHAQRDLLKPERTALTVDSTPKGPSAAPSRERTAAPSRERTQAEDFPKWVKPGKSFGLLTGAAQLVFLVIFFRSTLDDSKLIIDDSTASRYFGVTLMIFLGFGYLRAFLKAYGLGAIGFTMLIASLGMQWSMILESLARKAELKVDSSALLHADLGVAAVLVSFGAVIGRISPTQIVMLVLLELPVYTINKVFLIHQFDTSKHVRDGGSTIVVHVFGAYFGLAAATVLGPAVKDRLKCSSYQSDIFSLIGTMFLWMFLPTFVAVEQVTPDLQSKAHSAWAERFCREVGAPYTNWPNSKVPERRLRIGYISPDFFHHSVSFFVHALLEHANEERFEIFIYSNATREDDKTELFKSIVPPQRWRKVVGLPAVEACELMRADQIDILVELAGHTANNRLDVIALKAAPIQITYIGYNNTTGLGAIDYRLVDEMVDPLDTTQPFSEELVRVPGCFLCYTPPSRVPDIEELPALRHGFVTFGSFSCLAKVGDPVVALWARCLHEVPNSRLLVKNKGFYSPDVQATFIAKFKACGIPEHRLKLMALAPTSYEHLNIYNEVDIALDTFPYSNTTTTCESLLMGVPAVTLVGNTHGSRVCYTLLNAIGIGDFAAHSQEAYVTKVKGLCSNLQTLALLRQNLRQIMLSSPLCDGPGFVREKYEPILLEKWAAYCNGRAPSQQVFSSSEPPDPLAPGPFAPPLMPGQPFLQGPGSTSNPQGQMAMATMPVANQPMLTQAIPMASTVSPQQLSFCPTGLVIADGSPMSPIMRPTAWQVAQPAPTVAQVQVVLPGESNNRRRQRNNRIHPGRRA